MSLDFGIVPGLDVHLCEVDDALGEGSEGAAGVEGGGEAAARVQFAPARVDQRGSWLG